MKLLASFLLLTLSFSTFAEEAHVTMACYDGKIVAKTAMHTLKIGDSIDANIDFDRRVGMGYLDYCETVDPDTGLNRHEGVRVMAQFAVAQKSKDWLRAGGLVLEVYDYQTGLKYKDQDAIDQIQYYSTGQIYFGWEITRHLYVSLRKVKGKAIDVKLYADLNSFGGARSSSVKPRKY